MSKNIIKAIALCLITLLSLEFSTFYINDYVLEVEAKEKTLADALVKRQMQQALKDAEEKIEKAKQEKEIVVETEEVEMKPPVEVAKPPKEEVVAVEEIVEPPAEETAKIVIPGLGEFEKLNEGTIEIIGTYLVENYFLNGYVYSANETNPELKTKKVLACEMEAYVVESLHIMIELLDMFTTMNFEGTEEIIQNVTEFSAKFKEKYINIQEYGQDFVDIYNFINQYFEKSLLALNKINDTITIMNDSPNKVLAMTVVLASLDKEIMPALKDILNSSFDLKEKTNSIYLEGIEGVQLLTKEDVKEILKILQNAVFESQPIN